MRGEGGFDLGVDVLAYGFEVDGGCVGGVGSARRCRVGHRLGEGGAGEGAVVGAGVAEFEEGAEAGVEGFGVFAGALEGFADGLAACGGVVGGGGAQGPPGAVDAGEFLVGEAGDEFAEGGEVVDGDGELDVAVVGADAFGAAVAGEFGVDGEGAGFEFFDGSP
ncbi:hypothetical protein SMICM17S_03424 [Streptomyces microflavus]